MLQLHFRTPSFLALPRPYYQGYHVRSTHGSGGGAELFRTGKVARKIPQECSKTRDGRATQWAPPRIGKGENKGLLQLGRCGWLDFIMHNEILSFFKILFCLCPILFCGPYFKLPSASTNLVVVFHGGRRLVG